MQLFQIAADPIEYLIDTFLELQVDQNLGNVLTNCLAFLAQLEGGIEKRVGRTAKTLDNVLDDLSGGRGVRAYPYRAAVGLYRFAATAIESWGFDAF